MRIYKNIFFEEKEICVNRSRGQVVPHRFVMDRPNEVVIDGKDEPQTRDLHYGVIVQTDLIAGSYRTAVHKYRPLTFRGQVKLSSVPQPTRFAIKIPFEIN